MNRPQDSNADQWHLFLSEYVSTRPNQVRGLEFVALRIAEAIDEARRKSKQSDPLIHAEYNRGLEDAAMAIEKELGDRREFAHWARTIRAMKRLPE